MPTLTFYPDAEPETTSVDGQVGHLEGIGGVDWAALIAAAGSTSNAVTTYCYAMLIKSGATTDKWSWLYRSILLFDTSSISSKIITSAVLSVYGYSKGDTGSFAPDLNVYSSNPASATDLADADFATLGATPYCDTAITYANFDDAGWNHFVLNATGLAAINRSGITKFGLQNANYDVAASAPVWASAKTAFMRIHTADQAGDYRPKLTVTVNEPGSLWIEGADLRYLDENNDERPASPVLMESGTLAETGQNAKIFAWQNTKVSGSILVHRVLIDVTTPSTAAAKINVGQSAADAASDNLIDGAQLGVSRVIDNIDDKGVNGATSVKVADDQYITGYEDNSADPADLVGKYYIFYSQI